MHRRRCCRWPSGIRSDAGRSDGVKGRRWSRYVAVVDEPQTTLSCTGSTALGRRLTVVLLTFDCVDRLAPVLERLLALGVPVVAVDNGSTDDTVAVLRDAGVLVVALPSNIGAAGRNAGVAAARTRYVLFCDDDGWYEPDGLAAACDLLDA